VVFFGGPPPPPPPFSSQVFKSGKHMERGDTGFVEMLQVSLNNTVAAASWDR